MRLRTLRIFGAVATTSLAVAGGGFAATAVAAPAHHGYPGGRFAKFFGGHRRHHASTLYVAPTGVSTNDGSSCAQAAYSTIQAAVTAAAPYSTVFVCAGTYAEDVAVAQPLTLQGQNAVINATGKDNGVVISSSHVVVEGFAVRGATGEGILAVGKLTPSLVPIGAPAGSTTGVPISDVTITKNIVQGNDQGPPTSAYAECQASDGVPGDCGEAIHLMSVASSIVSRNYVTGNSGGILLTDEFGPTHGNTIDHNIVSNNADDCGVTLPSHNGLAVDPTTLAPAPALAGVYDNTVRNNTIISNGLKGFGAGIVIAAPFPGSASYDNVVSHNLIEGNGLAGVTLHSHAPGAFVGGNQIVSNTIGVNNLTGDSPLSPATGPFAAPAQFQADTQTTGILVWSLATPTTVTIANNTILGDVIGIWLNPTVTATGASTNNEFYGVTTAVGP
jgi:nitrous oxidase accessory protein NosD